MSFCSSRAHAALVVAVSLILVACPSNDDPNANRRNGSLGNSGNVELLSVQFGRLVDVYGLSGEGGALALYLADVVIGLEIADQRPVGVDLPDRDVEYDFLSVDPTTLAPRLLIPRAIGSAEFDAAFTRLGSRLTRVTAGVFGQQTNLRPHSLVPRNAALELRFSEPLGVDDDYFVTRDAAGVVDGVRNTEAIQLLAIIGDPNDPDATNAFRPLPVRILVRGDRVVLDPVLLGEEGDRYGSRNTASGLPGSADSFGANVRLAIALEGALAIDGIYAADDSPFLGRNRDGRRSVIRDFRTGNASDSSSTISNGFLRDPDPPRLLGSLPFLLAGLDQAPSSDGTAIVTLWKNGIRHEVDRGDVLRLFDRERTVEVLTEVVADPDDDRFDPDREFVRATVRGIADLQRLDPRAIDGYPSELDSPAGRQWLASNAAFAVLEAEFTASRIDPVTDRVTRDDARYFLTFSPGPLPQMAGYDPEPGQPSRPNEHISPFAAAVVRFNKPIDIATVRAFDSLFFATRDVLDAAEQDRFRARYGLNASEFSAAKYATPHLIDARVFDESGSQTVFRLQPTQGFYLDPEMRRILRPTDIVEPGGEPTTGTVGPALPAGAARGTRPSLGTGPADAGVLAAKRLPYYLHLVGGLTGVRDLAGNPLDLQDAVDGTEYLAVPFTLDGRIAANGVPLFPDNRVVSIVRRFASSDEDAQPSLYQLGVDPREYQFPMADSFGAGTYTSDGQFVARSATRVRRYVDANNQQPPPSQDTVLRWCPQNILQGGRRQGTRPSNSAATAFGQGIQNPLNPFGSRLQTVWRELDLSLSRVDPSDFDLDVEQISWAPLTTASIFYDIFDSVSLFLGHSEYRPEPCVGQFSALPTFPNSGLSPTPASSFADNYAHNRLPTGVGATKGESPDPHPAYRGSQLVIQPGDTNFEPTGQFRYLPLPRFERPYFVWRDQTLEIQGGETTIGSDIAGFGTTPVYVPYILSPFMAGKCSPLVRETAGLVQTSGFWDNRNNVVLGTNAIDTFTGGLLGAIALPLLADFQTDCDSLTAPIGDGFRASGVNGWQISLAVTSDSAPNFRAFSGGGGTTGLCIGPGDDSWVFPRGQLGLTGNLRVRGDNSVYWAQVDFLKRQSVQTFGFVELFDPHRMPARSPIDLDPRLGPYFQAGRPAGIAPVFVWHFEPPLESLQDGTSIVPEFRAASRAERGYWADPTETDAVRDPATGRVNPAFAQNPLCAGDAHLQKFDRRPFGGAPRRDFWTRYYTEHITRYTTDIADLTRTEFLEQFRGPAVGDTLGVEDLEYFNWRFVCESNPDVEPPVSPRVESFAISYRFEAID